MKENDKHLQTQNKGILVKGDETIGYIDYFSVLIDIIQLHYLGRNILVLSKCDWWDVYHKKKLRIQS